MSKNDQLAELTARAEGPLQFWDRSLQNFRQVCRLFPSSPFVGRAMSWAIAERPADHVVELGAGTGAVTRQLVRHAVASDQLTLLESTPSSVHEIRYPDICWARKDAARGSDHNLIANIETGGTTLTLRTTRFSSYGSNFPDI